MKQKTASKSKQFNPDFEYSFWFWRPKINIVLEMLALLIDYDFMDGEIEGILLELNETDSENPSKWSGGLHYGKKDVIYLKLAQNIENKDIIHCFIATHKILKERIEFIDLMQEHYKRFQ